MPFFIADQVSNEYNLRNAAQLGIAQMIDHKPVLLLDFDGTVHRATSPLTDPLVISDGITAGFFLWAYEASRAFRIAIFGPRSTHPGAIAAMQAWILREHASWAAANNQSRHPANIRQALEIEFPSRRPQAFLQIDDRSVGFRGSWADMDPRALQAFRPWTQMPKLIAGPRL